MPLFDRLSLALARGDKACLVGRNAAGKSTLLKALAGEQALESGERFVQPGLRIAYLPQDPPRPAALTVADYVAARPSAGEQHPGHLPSHLVDAALARLALDGTRALRSLSGGEARRADLARALAGAPDVLLLDEPTNHLDLPTIERLEQTLGAFGGALLTVSHDRAFLARTCNATLWLDRGRLRRLDKGFAHFEAWAAAERGAEAERLHRLGRQIVREERWLARGVTARRKRNQGRLTRLNELRQARAQWLHAPGSARLSLASGVAGGDKVIEAEGLAKSFRDADGAEQPVLRGFSTRIRRGDRIGLIGPNGAGKTTLARLLIGQLKPDAGRVVLGARVSPLYFDQRRESLDPETSLWRTLVPEGGDSLMVGGRQRHVVSYLSDFLFDEGQARQPVKSLSGGERNRLLLARLFARPSNLLVLDEPTNDLDMETLDLLLDVLDDYDGTLLLVSHDRDFLDRLVSSVIALEGDGLAREQVGGYSDYAARRDAARAAAPTRPARPVPKPRPQRVPPAKLGYRDQRQLDRLPGEIEGLEARIRHLEATIADPGLYGRDRAAFDAALAELTAARQALGAAEARWLELEQRREAAAEGT